MKKLLSVLLAIVLIISVVPLGAFTFTVSASTAYTDAQYFSFIIVNNEAFISGMSSEIGGDITIPETIGGYSVTGIANSAFMERKDITSVTMGDNVKTVGADAFRWCDALHTVNLGNGLTNIGYGAFSGCGNLKNINLPDSLTYIHDYAFYGCEKLSNINIGPNVWNIGEYAFEYCSSIRWFEVVENNSAFRTVDGVLFDEDMKTLMYYPACKEDKEYIIPNSVKYIDEAAFADCRNLEYVSVPEGVEEIALGTFRRNRVLKKIDLPSTLIKIGYMAFSECKSLKNIIIPNGVKTIEENAFFICENLTSIVLPSSVKNIYDDAFMWCDSLTDVWYEGNTIDKSIISIGRNNTDLTDAKWHYLVCNSDEHQYDDACDGSCNNCSWTRVPHVYKNACDLVCDECGEERNWVAHNHSECFVGYEENIELLGEWKNTPTQTGIYVIKPYDYSEDFTYHYLVVTDEDGNEVKFNDKKNGWPLVKGEKYTLKLKCQYDETPVLDILFRTLMTVDTIFPDTSAKDWYNDAVTYAVGRGIISGYSNGNFGTSDGIQRQDFLVMLARLDGVNLAFYERNDNTFPDMTRKSYYEAAVMWGYKNDIVTGYDDGRFGVGDKVTREQLVTFLYRYAQHIGVDVTVDVDAESAIAAQYADFNNVSPFAKDAVVWAIENGVISGTNATTIAPQGKAQRCEVAKIMYNIYLNNIF